MKNIIWLFLLLITGCQNSPKDETAIVAVQKKPLVKKTSLYATTDSVIIALPNSDTIIYQKDEFNELIDNFPIFYDSLPDHPDIAYHKSGIFKEVVDSDGNKKTISFSGETGKDQFYILYAYFLQQYNKNPELINCRERLIQIYHTINDIFSSIGRGGTYFMHQYYRINGYAEYGVFLYRLSKQYDEKTYNINKQKKLYIALLKQRISDELDYYNDWSESFTKSGQIRNLFRQVESLDSMLTENFYLDKAQEFQFSNY